MADENFDILIRILAQQVGTEKAQDILKKVREESTLTGKEGVKQQQAVAEATKKTFTSKKQLLDMVKGLGHEFPILGQLGRLALNPIAFTVAAITASFSLWNTRIRELSESLGGIEMPDLKESKVELVERQARAYGTLADKLLAVGTNAKSAAEGFAQAEKIIGRNEQLAKALGFDTGDLGLRSQVGNAAEKAMALEAEGRAQIAAARSPMSPAEEAIMAGRLKRGATSAEEVQAAASGRISDIRGIGDLSGPSRVWANAKFLRRYGGISPADAIAREEGLIAGQQPAIDRYGGFLKDQTARGKMQEAGEANLEAARGYDARVPDLLAQIAANTAGKAAYPGGAMPSMTGNPGQFAAFMAQIGAFAANLPVVLRQIEEANRALAAIKQRP